MFTDAISLGIIYVVVLIFFSSRWKRIDTTESPYTFNCDQRFFLEDQALFNKRYLRSIANLKTDLEKSEWTCEKLKDLFQMFISADVTLWPYQLAVSLLAGCIVMNHLRVKIVWTNIATTTFILFVLMDLPRRFLSFHRNALIANKAVNLYTYYYKYLKQNRINQG
jgi:hypothetical protein